MRSAGRRPSVFLPAGEWIWHWHSTCWMSGTHEEDRRATTDGDEVEAWPVDSSRAAPQATRRPAPTCCTLNGAPTAPNWQPGTRGGADLDWSGAASRLGGSLTCHGQGGRAARQEAVDERARGVRPRVLDAGDLEKCGCVGGERRSLGTPASADGEAEMEKIPSGAYPPGEIEP